MKTIKPGKIEKYIYPEKEDMDKVELDLKEKELQNRRNSIKDNDKAMKLMQQDIELMNEAFDISIEECEVIRDDPIGFTSGKGEAYANFLKKAQEYKIKRIKAMHERDVKGNELKVKALQEQKDRCNQDIKDLSARISILKDIISSKK